MLRQHSIYCFKVNIKKLRLQAKYPTTFTAMPRPVLFLTSAETIYNLPISEKLGHNPSQEIKKNHLLMCTEHLLNSNEAFSTEGNERGESPAQKQVEVGSWDGRGFSCRTTGELTIKYSPSLWHGKSLSSVRETPCLSSGEFPWN